METNKKSNKKYKIILVVSIAIIVMLIVIQFGFKKPIIQEGPYTILAGFTQELYAEGDGNPDTPEWNYVVFPFSILYCQSNDSVENIFESALEDSGDLWIFHEQALEGWISWSSERWKRGFPNELEIIEPYQIYYVNVEFDCILSISWD